MTTPIGARSTSSRKDQRVPSVSLAAVGTRVDSAKRASASRLSIFTGSSNHAGSYSSSARAMRIALGRFQSECSSTISSIRSPTASRTLRNGSMPLRRSSSEIDWPPVASAYGSKGQIFMPVMPCSSRLSRERPRVGQEPVEILVRPGRGTARRSSSRPAGRPSPARGGRSGSRRTCCRCGSGRARRRRAAGGSAGRRPCRAGPRARCRSPSGRGSRRRRR